MPSSRSWWAYIPGLFVVRFLTLPSKADMLEIEILFAGESPGHLKSGAYMYCLVGSHCAEVFPKLLDNIQGLAAVCVASNVAYDL
jgi:hypothetical protein